MTIVMAGLSFFSSKKELNISLAHPNKQDSKGRILYRISLNSSGIVKVKCLYSIFGNIL
jgi:hypothetical protein